MRERCVVCGKPVTANAIRISKGFVQDEVWIEDSIWGIAHGRCFARAVNSPSLTIDELRNDTRSIDQAPR
jgi:hypothetical protein